MTNDDRPTTGPTRKPERTWLLIILAFMVFWIAYLALLAPRPPALPLENTGSSQPASYDWPLLDLKDDSPVSFSRFKGRTVFLNVWATWCPPCVREMPSIARLAEGLRPRDKDVAFVCVSVDESSDTVRQFLEGRSWNMSFFRTERLPGIFRTEGIPATFIIAPDGRIAASQVCADDWDKPEIAALLEKLATAPRGR